MVGRPPKIPNVALVIRKHVRSGNFIILPHAAIRIDERRVSVAEIVFVLLHGEHEVEKDEFKEAFQSWNYSIKGLTIDARMLRVAVSFDDSGMLIVTVIPLGKRRV